jgi:hypothetical protein
VELDHDFHAVADGTADLLKGLQRRLEIRPGDRPTVARLGGEVERPDLHRRDAFGQERVGELVGPVEEGVEIIEIHRGAEAPIGARLALSRPHVPGAGARVVGANGTAREAAEELDDRLPRGLPEQIPKCNVEGRVAADFRPRGPEAEIAVEVLRDAVDREGIAPEHLRCDHLVHIGLDRPRHEEGLAETE